MRGRWVSNAGMALLLVAAVGADAAAVGPGRGAGTAEAAARRGSEGSDSREARRRWALARMDEMTHERQRCRTRFTAPRQVAECEAEYGRRYREYNRIYLEASRE